MTTLPDLHRPAPLPCACDWPPATPSLSGSTTVVPLPTLLRWLTATTPHLTRVHFRQESALLACVHLRAGTLLAVTVADRTGGVAALDLMTLPECQFDVWVSAAGPGPGVSCGELEGALEAGACRAGVPLPSHFAPASCA